MLYKKRLLVLDSNSLIHRAFHALPPLSTKEGKEVGAVYGFLLSFFKAIKDFEPDFLIAAFDFKGPTFRHKEFKKYKAKRPKMPSELSQQFPEIKKILKAFNVLILEKEKFEADDIIGTVARKFSKKQIIPSPETVALSGDLDLLQLVNKETKVCFLRKGVKNTIIYNEEKVKERYQGLLPEQIPEYKGLRGDPSDNIPGVPGIGQKTGTSLILRFKTLENLYREIEKGDSLGIKERIKDILITHKDEALLSRKLATINCSVPIDFSLEECSFGSYNSKNIIEILKELNFLSLVDKIPKT